MTPTAARGASRGMQLFDRVWRSAIAWSWAALLARGLGLLLVLPLALRGFPSETIALWLALGALVAVQALCDLGFVSTFVRLVAYSFQPEPSAGAQGTDWRQIARSVETIQPLFLLLGLSSLCVFGLLGSWYLAPLIDATADPADSWYAWALVLVCSSIMVSGAGFSALLNGVHQVVVVRRWEAAFAFASTLSGSAWLLAGTGSLSGLIACTQVWSVLCVLVLALRARQCLAPHVDMLRWRFDRSVIGKAWPASWRSQIGTLASHGNLQLGVLAYARLAAPDAAASLLLALQLMFALVQLSAPPFYSRLPALATRFARKELEQLAAEAEAGIAASCWTFSIGAVAGGMLFPAFLDAMGSRTPFVHAGVWAMLALAFYAERVGSMNLQLCALSNNINWHIANTVNACLFATAMLVLVPVSLEYSIPAAMLLSYGGFQIRYGAIRARRYLMIDTGRLTRRAVLRPAVSLLCYLALATLAPVWIS